MPPCSSEAAADALVSFARLDGTNRLLGGRVLAFDMRAPDRIYLRVPGLAAGNSAAASPAVATTAPATIAPAKPAPSAHKSSLARAGGRSDSGDIVGRLAARSLKPALHTASRDRP